MIVHLLMHGIIGMAAPMSVSNINDTIPPTFIETPRDTSILCIRDENIAIDQWLNLNARATAQDNSGMVEILTTLTQEEILFQFSQNARDFCGSTSAVEVGFYAIDTCGNTSDTIPATFSTRDPIDPQFTIDPQPLTVHCDDAGDLFIQAWLRNRGGSEAGDACSQDIRWEFFWPPNNVGNPNDGPFIELADFGCDDVIEVNFIAIDDCDNTFSRQVAITIFDTIAPVFLDPIPEITVNCENIEASPLFARDNCLGIFQASFRDESNQASDPEQCEYYNYDITRTWTARDQCGGEINFVQNVIVTDDQVPEFDVPDNITVSCDQDISPASLGQAFNIMDNCDTNPIIEFSDSESGDPCLRTINRFWSVMDACNGSSTIAQRITVADSIAPNIGTEAQDLILSCTDDLESNFASWIDNMGGATASENCSALNMFAALTGSYNANSSATYPGTFPSTIEFLSCENRILTGNWVDMEVDFFYYDECDNFNVSQAQFIVTDTDTLDFATPAADLEVSCNEDFQAQFDDWLLRLGDTELRDIACTNTRFFAAEQGSYVIGDTTTFPGSIDTILSLEGCGDEIDSGILISKTVDFVYYTECGEAVASTATFTVVDVQSASLETEASDLSFTCTQDYNPEYIQWIQDLGGVVINETCPLDQTFAALPGSYNLDDPTTFPGELPMSIDIDSCLFSIADGIVENRTIDFVFVDNCGNAVVSQGNFQITIPEESIIITQAADLQVSCEDDIATIYDNWIMNNGGMEIAQSCTVLRSFQAESDSYDIEDSTTFPGNLPSGDIFDACSDIDRVDVDFVFIDECNNAIVNSATFTILREEPTINNEAKDTVVNCSTDYQAIYNGWIEKMAGSSAQDSCNLLQSFAAIPNSYDIDDTLTYPGTIMSTIDIDKCINDGRIVDLANINVDFVYYNECGQSLVTNATFSITSTSDQPALVEPSHITLDCADDYQGLFDNWIATMGGGAYSQTCSELQSFAAESGSYSIGDSTTYPGTLPNEIEFLACDMIIADTLVKKVIDFVYYDTCNTTVVNTAIFTVLNSNPLAFTSTPQDTTIMSDISTCKGEINITFPTFVSRCIDEDISTTILIDGAFVPVDENVAQASLDPGVHNIEYLISDCAGNISTTFSTINVTSDSQSTISCGTDITVTLPPGTCQTTIELPQNFDVDLGCTPTSNIQLQSPTDASNAFLQFAMHPETDTLVAEDINFEFTNVSSNALSDVTLTLDVIADMDEAGESLRIIGEDNMELGTLSNAICSDSGTQVPFVISRDKYNEWASDGIINITCTSQGVDLGESLGINPCMNIPQGDNRDGISRIVATIDFTSFEATYTIQNEPATPFPSGSYRPVDDFGVGISEVIYTVNFDQKSEECRFNVEVIDTELPSITCNADTVAVSIFEAHNYSLSIGKLFDVTDNCTLADTTLTPNLIQCVQNNTSYPISLRVRDQAGNIAECTSNLQIEITSLKPQFISGLCSGETIRLEANIDNVPDLGAFSFSWSGPNGFTSNEVNPIIDNATSSNSGNYTLTVNSNTGCSASGNVDVQIETLQRPAIVADTDFVCAGNEIILSATQFSGNVTYLWYINEVSDANLVAETNTPELPINIGEDNETYIVIIRDVDCTSEASVPFTITPQEITTVATNTSTLELCEDEPLELSITNPDPNLVYVWTGPNALTSTGTSLIIQNAIISQSGVYSVTAQRDNCFSDETDIEVTVIPNPAQPTIIAQSVYCTGAPVTLSTDAFGDTYEWLRDGVSFTTQDTPDLIFPMANEEVDADWQIIVSSSSCRSAISPIFSIRVNEMLPIAIMSNSPVCDNEDLQLTTTQVEDANYQWEGPNNFSSSEVSPQSDPISGVYRVTVTSSSGCISTATTDVDVTPRPTITSIDRESGSTECLDGTQDIRLSSTISPSGNYQYMWSGPNGYTSTEEIATIPNATSSAQGAYTLTVMNDQCNSEISSYELELTASPEIPIIAGLEQACPGINVEYTVVNAQDNIDVYVWDTPRGQISTELPTLMIESVDALDIGSYSVTMRIGSCISENSTPIVLSLDDKPNTPVISTTSPTCLGSQVELFTTPTIGATYEWTGPNGFSSTIHNPTINNLSTNQEGPYEVRIAIGECISDWSSPFELVVKAIPQPPSLVSFDESICANEINSITLCTNDIGNETTTTFYLEDESNTLGTTNSSCLLLESTSMFALGSNNVFAISELDECTSTPSNPITIEVGEVPVSEANAGDNFIVCAEEDIFIVGNLPPNSTATWTSDNPDIDITNPDRPATTISGLVVGDNFVYYTLEDDVCGPYSQDTVIIHVLPDVEINDDAFDFFVDVGSTTLDVTANDSISDDFTIKILQAALETRAFVDDNNQIAIAPDSIPMGTYEIMYEVCSIPCPSLCDMATITIDIAPVEIEEPEENDDCYATNLLTPNGDNINDTFTIPCLDTGLFPNNRVTIINTWGDEVFSAAPYMNNWQGTYDGDVLASGTYYYVITLDDTSSSLSGFITIER